MQLADPTRSAHGPAEGLLAKYAHSVGHRPVLSVVGKGWEHVSLERYRVPSVDLKLGELHVHRVSLHLAGPVLVERTRDGRRDRRWSGLGCTNLIPAGVPVPSSVKGQADFIVACIAPTIVDEVAGEVFQVHPARVRLVETLAIPDQMLERFCRLLVMEAETGGSGTRLFTDTVTRALALHLLRAYADEPSRPIAPPGGLVAWRLRRAMEYMHSNLAENLSLSELAAATNLSPSHFARAFRATTGEPPHRYLVRLRIDHARHLLEHTRLPVIEIGVRCGFAQTTHFATMFRKITGLCPRAYRAARCF